MTEKQSRCKNLFFMLSPLTSLYMQQIIPFNFQQQQFVLSAHRCIYWQNEHALIVSDLHFGKTGHFRKEGIAIPQAIYKEDVQRLFAQIQLFKPKQLIIIGDMFHSYANKELAFFKKWRHDIDDIKCTLIRGNHDILATSWYADCNIDLVEKKLVIQQICFVHDILDIDITTQQSDYYFSGHIHPCISIKGIAKQTLQLPCFYFSKQYAVLPAFSKFTGGYPIKPKRGENVFAILPNNALKNELGGIIKM